MDSSSENFRPLLLGFTLAFLLTAAWVTRSLDPRSHGLVPRLASQGEQLKSLGGSSGGLALLGGMRSLVASGFWLRANLAWERRDAVATEALINATVAADERSLYFWLNGARILANDMPEWRMAGPVPAALRPRVNEEQAQVALRFLEKGLRWHGPDAALYIEMANIHLRRRGDAGTAAHFYRLAAEQPNAPYYAARIHAELLHEIGRGKEALVWLREILPGLPAGDPLARRDVVLERINALEQELATR
jgi:hypothetical protein